MLVTSVLGHISNYRFPASYKNWRDTPIEELYRAPLQKDVIETSIDVVKNLKSLSKDIE